MGGFLLGVGVGAGLGILSLPLLAANLRSDRDKAVDMKPSGRFCCERNWQSPLVVSQEYADRHRGFILVKRTTTQQATRKRRVACAIVSLIEPTTELIVILRQ